MVNEKISILLIYAHSLRSRLYILNQFLVCIIKLFCLRELKYGLVIAVSLQRTLPICLQRCASSRMWSMQALISLSRCHPPAMVSLFFGTKSRLLYSILSKTLCHSGIIPVKSPTSLCVAVRSSLVMFCL